MIYLLVYWDGDTTTTAGVYSSKEMAEGAMEWGRKLEKYYYVDFYIVEFPLNTNKL